MKKRNDIVRFVFASKYFSSMFQVSQTEGFFSGERHRIAFICVKFRVGCLLSMVI